MDYADLARQAGDGEVKAFVELTRRFQHAAFGSALALIGDFQQAEDVVQEAFLAAWSALPSLADPEAFPGWLRTIVRPPCLPPPAAKGVVNTAAGRSSRDAERGTCGRSPDRTASARHSGACNAVHSACSAARTSDAVFCSRVLAPGHRDISRPHAGNGE